MSSTDRLSLALPVDVVRQFDHTVTQTQLQNNTFQGTPDDRDMLASHLEDAEDEFRATADMDVRLAREGSPGNRETFEQVTHKVKGHQAFKRAFSRVGRDYAVREVRRSLEHDRVMPFDTDEGDEAHVYRGTRRTGSDTWEDISGDAGDTWDIIDHRGGILVFHPAKLMRATVTGGHGLSVGGTRLDELRVAISYRHGALGGGRGLAGETALGETLDDSETPDAVDLTDAARLPGRGDVTLLVGDEYLRADVDVPAGTMDVLERGVRGTDATAHDGGARVRYTPGSVRKAVAARAAMTLIQAGRYSAWLPDADDEVDKGDMLEELRATWERTLEAVRA